MNTINSFSNLTMINAVLDFLEIICLANIAILLTVITIVIIIILFGKKPSD